MIFKPLRTLTFSVTQVNQGRVYLNEEDVEIDGLLATADVVGDDIRDEGIFWSSGVHWLL